MLKDRVGRKFTSRHRGGDAICSELTFAQSNVLMVVHEKGVLSLKELADALHVSRPSASAMVDKLVEMEVLEREQSQIDRREVRIRVSKSGQLNFCQMEEEILQYITDLLIKLGPDYAAQWCDVYAQIRKIVQAEMLAEATASDTKDTTE